jgi:NitT/TauT family transport system substrate-binding protein
LKTILLCLVTIALIALIAPSIVLAKDPVKTKIALNWVPEPEFGGIYAAQQSGAFNKYGLDATIQPGGAGAPTWQMVASGQIDFAVASADEVVIARSQGAKVQAIFTTYQTCPQGLMTHASRHLNSIADIFSHPGTLAVEPGLPYVKFLRHKYSFDKLKVVPFDGGIGNFLADANFTQQCFVFSEPLAAKKAGGDPQVFLVADAGYDPYTGVIITSDKMMRDHPDVVGAMTGALIDGWRSYLDHPEPANDVMAKLNRTMDRKTFTAAADAQKKLIESDQTKSHRLGWMTEQRWEQLVKQLAELKVVRNPPPAKECFKNPEPVAMK